jgi:hypothetical protein
LKDYEYLYETYVRTRERRLEEDAYKEEVEKRKGIWKPKEKKIINFHGHRRKWI